MSKKTTDAKIMELASKKQHSELSDAELALVQGGADLSRTTPGGSVPIAKVTHEIASKEMEDDWSQGV